MEKSVALRARLVRARLAHPWSAIFFAALACSTAPSSDTPATPTPTAPPGGAAAEPDTGTPTAPGPAPAVVFPKTSQRERPTGHAWVFDGPGSAPRKQEIPAAEAAGYTVIDLGNNWVPYIFSEKTVGVEDLQTNDYRKRYVDLANVRVDADG